MSVPCQSAPFVGRYEQQINDRRRGADAVDALRVRPTRFPPRQPGTHDGDNDVGERYGHESQVDDVGDGADRAAERHEHLRYERLQNIFSRNW